MIKLDNYLYDGARWQARAVMCYLQDQVENILDKTYTGNAWDLYGGKLFITHYLNGREKGYVFSLRYNGKQVNYAVFNHCISDCICLMRSECLTDTPDGWEGREWSKHDHDKEFAYDEVVKCGKWIEGDMIETLYEWQKAEGRYKKDDEE
jgi:hypothetical protein